MALSLQLSCNVDRDVSGPNSVALVTICGCPECPLQREPIGDRCAEGLQHRGGPLFCPDSAGTVARVNAIIESFRSSGEPMIYIRHCHQADGSDLERIFDSLDEWDGQFNFKEHTAQVEYDVPADGADRIDQEPASCFGNTPLQQLLEQQRVDTVVISGFVTNFCCDTTERELMAGL